MAKRNPESEIVGKNGPTLGELAAQRREQDEQAQRLISNAIDSVRDRVMAHPWLAVAGAALIGGALNAVMEKKAIRKGSSRAKVRDWLEDSFATMPTQKQFKSLAKSAQLPLTIEEFRNRANDDFRSSLEV